jgi:hypothetical protein
VGLADHSESEETKETGSGGGERQGMNCSTGESGRPSKNPDRPSQLGLLSLSLIGRDVSSGYHLTSNKVFCIMTTDASSISLLFQGFRADLDDHVCFQRPLHSLKQTTQRLTFLLKHDRRERLIKASRDLTALSKKLIFHLHR